MIVSLAIWLLTFTLLGVAGTCLEHLCRTRRRDRQ